MKLYDPKNANGWVFAYAGKNAKEGAAPTYGCVQAESIEDAERYLEQKALHSVYPYPMGKYDEFGRYCTYKPPVDGIAPGRFVLHPLAEEEHKRERMHAWH
jgi:hypothetical protein